MNEKYPTLKIPRAVIQKAIENGWSFWNGDNGEKSFNPVFIEMFWQEVAFDPKFWKALFPKDIKMKGGYYTYSTIAMEFAFDVVSGGNVGMFWDRVMNLITNDGKQILSTG